MLPEGWEVLEGRPDLGGPGTISSPSRFRTRQLGPECYAAR